MIIKINSFIYIFYIFPIFERNHLPNNIFYIICEFNLLLNSEIRSTVNKLIDTIECNNIQYINAIILKIIKKKIIYFKNSQLILVNLLKNKLKNSFCF